MPTNEQVWKFYLDKPEESPAVRKYLLTVEENPGNNAYLGLYHDFQILTNGSSEQLKDPEDKGFYEWLREGPRPQPLKAIVPWALNPATFPDKGGQRIPSPKWHLYVSWFALKAYWDSKDQEQWNWNAAFDRHIKNYVLRLWMAEGAIRKGANLTIGLDEDGVPTKAGIPSLGKILDAIDQKS